MQQKGKGYNMNSISDKYGQNLIQKLKIFDEKLATKNQTAFYNWCNFVEIIFQNENIFEFDDLSNNGAKTLYQYAKEINYIEGIELY